MSFVDELSMHFLRAVESAALAAAKTMGQGDRRLSARRAVTALRDGLDRIDMQGVVVIGEEESEEPAVLCVGEAIGSRRATDRPLPRTALAASPLEGASLCASGGENAVSVLAAAEPGGLLQAADIYMNKIIVGPANKGNIDINAPVAENLKAIARGLNREVEDLVIVVLARDRHDLLTSEIRQSGARIKFIHEGELSAAIAAALRGTGVHAVMGIGGAAQAVMAAASLKCLNGDMQAKLFPFREGDGERMRRMGLAGGEEKVYGVDDLAPGNHLVVAACGVTNGALLKGIRFFGGGYRAQAILMTQNGAQKTVKFVEDVVLDSSDPIPISLY